MKVKRLIFFFSIKLIYFELFYRNILPWLKGRLFCNLLYTVSDSRGYCLYSLLCVKETLLISEAHFKCEMLFHIWLHIWPKKAHNFIYKYRDKCDSKAINNLQGAQNYFNCKTNSSWKDCTGKLERHQLCKYNQPESAL